MVYGSGTGSICYDQGLDEHTACSLKNHSKIKENGLTGQIFLRRRRACGAFAQWDRALSPWIGTPPLTITPVTS